MSQSFGEEHAAYGVAHCFAPQGLLFFLWPGAKTGAGEADAATAAKQLADGAREDLFHHDEDDDIEDEIEDSSHLMSVTVQEPGGMPGGLSSRRILIALTATGGFRLVELLS